MPAWAGSAWQVVRQTATETVFIDLASIERHATHVQFRERRVPREATPDPASQRPVHEVLLKRVVDCRKQRVAVLSRAVFSDNDALIDHQATRLSDAVWKIMAVDDPVFRRVCSVR